jgi:hypothetical protein
MLREILKIVNGMSRFRYALLGVAASVSPKPLREKATICRGTHKYGSI